MFNHEEFLTVYKHCTKRSTKSAMSEHEYVFQKNHATHLEVFIFDNGREWRYVHDNFPGQRRIFSSNIPITSIEDFENDLKRARIDLPERN